MFVNKKIVIPNIKLVMIHLKFAKIRALTQIIVSILAINESHIHFTSRIIFKMYPGYCGNVFIQINPLGHKSDQHQFSLNKYINA